jgi:peptidoglycan/xylan/chitin deacetylase (PgdA/CDA1 family)
MRLNAPLKALRRRGLAAMARRTVRAAGPAVSFTFDDFPRSAYLNGGGILSSHQVAGTFYAAMGLVGTINDLGEHFAVEDLSSLRTDGHELANHTFGHLSPRRVPLSRFVADVERGRQALHDHGGAERPNFSYPFGDVTIGAKRALSAGTHSCRGIFEGINETPIDLNLLKANSLYAHTFDLAAVTSLVRETERRAGWLIFYTHDVRDAPSAFGCTAAQFEAVVRLVRSRRLPVLTVEQALNSLS